MHSHISARMVTELTELVDLAAEALGGTVIAANDEFFAPKEALLKSTPAEWREGAYTERGKWMDGWETRRRRTPGYDWAIVHLGAPGVVRGVIIDTAFFRGNFPESASIEACEVDGTPSAEQMMSASTAWRTILPQSPLLGDTKNAFVLDDVGRVTHLRLNIFPDGGVARFRVHGEVMPAHTADAGAPLDLAACRTAKSPIRRRTAAHPANPLVQLLELPLRRLTHFGKRLFVTSAIEQRVEHHPLHRAT